MKDIHDKLKSNLKQEIKSYHIISEKTLSQIKEVNLQYKDIEEIQNELDIFDKADKFYKNNSYRRVIHSIHIWVLFKEKNKYRKEIKYYIKESYNKKILSKTFMLWKKYYENIKMKKINMNYIRKKIIFKHWKKYNQLYRLDPIIELRKNKIVYYNYYRQ